MSDRESRWWIDGALRAVDPLALAGLEAPRPDSSSYTTALVQNGRARWFERHVARLRRDAALLEFGEVDEIEIARILRETSLANFGAGRGVVRLQMLRGAGGPRFVAIPRALGEERTTWSAVTAPYPHDGPTRARGAKLAGRAVLEKAQQTRAAAAVDEVVLLDAGGRLIEGARSNLFVVDADGDLLVPDLSRGGVAGIAREILCELANPIVRDIRIDELRAARELIATNAVHGARAILTLDDAAVGSGSEGPVVKRLQALLAKS